MTGDENDLASIENSTREQKCGGFQMSAAPVRRWVSGSWKAKAGKAQKPCRSGEPGKYQRLSVWRESWGEVTKLGFRRSCQSLFFAAFKRKGVQPVRSPGKPPLGATTHWLSGDQAKLRCLQPANQGSRISPNCFSLPPMGEISRSKARSGLTSRKNAIHLPSGDQTGLESLSGSVVNRA